MKENNENDFFGEISEEVIAKRKEKTIKIIELIFDKNFTKGKRNNNTQFFRKKNVGIGIYPPMIYAYEKRNGYSMKIFHENYLVDYEICEKLIKKLC